MRLLLTETSGPLPTSHFDLREGNEFIGKLQLRHTPSKSDSFPEGFENHMYYEIEPAYRNKRYGTQILALGLDEARKIGLTEVILTCEEGNVASQKIIESNHGELLETAISSEGILIHKYSINLM